MYEDRGLTAGGVCTRVSAPRVFSSSFCELLGAVSRNSFRVLYVIMLVVI